MFSRRWGGGLKMKRGPGTILYWDLRWGFFGFLAKPRKSAIFSPQLARRLLGPFSGVSGVSRGFSPKPPQTPKTPSKPSQSPSKSYADFDRLCTNLHKLAQHAAHVAPSLQQLWGMCSKLVQHIYNVVHLLHNIHNTTHIISNYNNDCVQNLYICTQSAQ